MWRVLPELQELEVVIRAKTMSWVAIGMRAPGATVECRKFPLLPIERITEPAAYNNKGIARRKQFTQQNSFQTDNNNFFSSFRAQQQEQPLLDADFLHPMDCTDIVWGAAKGSLSRVRDMYTRERAMPHEDEFFGGKQSLTGATAFELNGRTTMIFRRRLISEHPTDAFISDALMHVTMAHGQSPDTDPLAELEARQFSSSNPFANNKNVVRRQHLSIRDYYRLDELKYHGYAHRVATQINFLAGAPQKQTSAASVVTNQQQQVKPTLHAATPQTPLSSKPCFGQYRMPSGCVLDVLSATSAVPTTCQYAAEWYYEPKFNGVRVSLFSSQPNKWLGIGWSQNGQMTNSHITTAWIGKNDHHITVTDRLAYGHFMPEKFVVQGSESLGGRRIGDVAVAVEFLRPLSSGKTSLDLSDPNCFYLLFPVHGGSYNETDHSITKHTTTPIVSDQKMCFNTCTAASKRNINNNNFQKPNLNNLFNM